MTQSSRQLVISGLNVFFTLLNLCEQFVVYFHQRKGHRNYSEEFFFLMVLFLIDLLQLFQSRLCRNSCKIVVSILTDTFQMVTYVVFISNWKILCVLFTLTIIEIIVNIIKICLNCRKRQYKQSNQNSEDETKLITKKMLCCCCCRSILSIICSIIMYVCVNLTQFILLYLPETSKFHTDCHEVLCILSFFFTWITYDFSEILIKIINQVRNEDSFKTTLQDIKGGSDTVKFIWFIITCMVSLVLSIVLPFETFYIALFISENQENSPYTNEERTEHRLGIAVMSIMMYMSCYIIIIGIFICRCCCR
jgi:hypothetical protein